MPEWTVLGIQAPVFGATGDLTCTVALTGFPYPLGPDEIRRIADRVGAVAGSMTPTTSSARGSQAG
jgi:DNA-binding IclR family transcriptional regulator